MEQNTKFEVSTMSKLEGEGAKAIATLVVNGEFAVHDVKVRENKEGGLFVAMPSEKQSNGKYKDVVFPITKEAREAINNAVMSAYEKLAASSEKTLKNEISAPEKSVSEVYAQMREVNSDNPRIKASGQITIDNCIVVSGVGVLHGTNAQGVEKDFVSMPYRKEQNKFGKNIYDERVHPITSEFKARLDKAVLGEYQKLQRTEYKGVKFSELLDENGKATTQYGMNSEFAEKLMEKLDQKKIPYSAKILDGKTSLSIKTSDLEAVKKIQSSLSASLEKAAEKAKAAENPEQKQASPKKSKTH